MRTTFFICLTLIFISQISNNSSGQKEISMEENTIIDTGTIHKAKPSEQCKKPVMPGDYFFRSKNHQSLFIKISKGKISKQDLDKYVDKKVQIEFEIRTGAWRESNNNPHANQKYAIVYSIKEIPKD
jgi:hypothetical protein